MSCWTVSGVGQFTTAPTLSKLGRMPWDPTLAPVKRTSVKKSLVFVGDKERLLRRHR